METKIQAWWFHLKAKLEILQYFSVYCTFFDTSDWFSFDISC